MRRFALTAAIAVIAAYAGAPTRADDRPRLLVMTDIGGDPDDQQSMIRLMTWSNEFAIEGLIATASGTRGELKGKVTRPDLIREIVEAYGKVRDNLARHADGYPTAEYLLDRIKSGNADRGIEAIGEGHDSEGSRFIIEVVDRDDPRPLNICIWGGQTDLAQALWRVRKERGDEGVARFAARLRIYDIGDQDGVQPWLFENFPDLFYVLGKPKKGADIREAVYRGMYLGGDESLTSREWLGEHVRTNHGPLGELYPVGTWTAPNPHSSLKEGDTPSWFYFLPGGLGDPQHPEWGGWGGRFRHEQRGLYRDDADTVGEETHVRAGVWRWRPAFQNEFQARMDWCVLPPDKANHPPVAVIDGDRSRTIVRLKAAPGDTLDLAAQESSDPDGDEIHWKWWIYREAGKNSDDAELTEEILPDTVLRVSENSAAGQVHVILEVTDLGTPPLTAYRRVVIDVER